MQMRNTPLFFGFLLVLSMGCTDATNNSTPLLPGSLLNTAVMQFDSAFQQARLLTLSPPDSSRPHEQGFIIYKTKTGELLISKLLQGDTAMISSALVLELEHPSVQVADPDELTLAGVYHTHVDKGVDANPFSAGDVDDLFRVLKDSSYYNVYNTKQNWVKRWYLSDGFFVIADDVNGGRYAAAIENVQLAHVLAEQLKKQYDDNFETAGPGQLTIGKSEGQKAREYLCKIFNFENTGIGIYYNPAYNSIPFAKLQVEKPTL
jgi:hypothetical protein